MCALRPLGHVIRWPSERSAYSGARPRPNFEELALLQSDERHYAVWRNGASFGHGDQAPGWASPSGAGGSAVALLRHIGQEYPKGVAVAPDSMGRQIWPGTLGANLTFTTPFEEPAVRLDRTRDEDEVERLLRAHPTAPLNLKSFDEQSPEDLRWVEDVVDRLAPERAAWHDYTGTDNGMDAAWTTEMALLSGAGRIADEAAAARRKPLLAPAELAYPCTTGAFGHFHPAGDPRFAAVDAGLDELMQTVAVEPGERCRTYGIMRYGNAVCSHAAGPAVA